MESTSPLPYVTNSETVDEAETLKPRLLLPGVFAPGGKPPINEQNDSFVFPLCDPNGCSNVNIAPINCKDCRKIETESVIFGMFLLSFVIAVANLLVIRVILHSPSLRRRHGYIKLSMATSDLLIGLLVIPAAIANIFLTLYYSNQKDGENDKLVGKRKFVDTQKNSTASVIFGVIAVISVTSSLYNLLLLSADRFLAIFRPLQHKTGRFFPKQRLFFSISAVWIFAVVLSMVPAFFPDKVYYEMDPSTFFFVQRVRSNSGSVFSSVYIGVIIGGPYVLTVLLIILTAFYTWKNLKVRGRLSSRGNMTKSAVQRKYERRNRIKMIQEAYPDALMEDDMNVASIKDYAHQADKTKKPRDSRTPSTSSETRCWLSWWKSDDCVFGNRPRNSNNNSNETNDSPRYQRTRDQISIVREILNPPARKIKKFNKKTHVRVFKMLLAMIFCFSICLLPYVIVMLKISHSPFECTTGMTVSYIFAIYLLFANSIMNFIIYNLLHPEFRFQLVKLLRNDLSKPGKIKNSISDMFSTAEQSTSRNSTGTTSFSNN